MRVRTFLAAGIAVVGLAAGCGGGGASAGAGASLGGAASVVPSSAAAFVAIDSSLGSAQWQALDGLLGQIPQHDALVTQLQQSFEQQTKLSWATDVKPALGPEVDIAVLSAASAGKPEVVVLTQPADRAKLDALLAKIAAAGKAKPVSAQVGGWTAISDSQAALDALQSANTALSSDTVYQEASGKLASDALVRAYANGAEAQQLVGALGGHTSAAKGQLVWAAADVVAQSGGLRVDGYVRSNGQTEQPYTPALVQRIPEGALAVADFQAQPEQGAASTPTSQLGAALAKLRAALGGETAVYVSPGLPIPSVTLATQPSDPQAVLDALHSALSSAGSAAAKTKVGGLDLGTLLGNLHLAHETVGSTLVVSTSQQAIDAFKASGGKLVDDGTFKEAQSASGMPSQTTGFLYVNVKDALPTVQGLLTLAGAKLPGGNVDLSALRTLTAYGSGGSGGISGFTVFLEVS